MNRAGRRPPVKSADRTLEVLEALAARRARAALVELARELDIPKSSLHGILRTMAQRGWVETDATGTRFGLGVRALQVGAAYLDADDAVGLRRRRPGRRCPAGSARPCTWAGSTAPNVVYMAKRESAHPLRLFSAIGRRLPAHATALGKALLAAARRRRGRPAARLAAARAHPAHASPTRTRCTPSWRGCAGPGYAVDREENTEGIMCFAVAVPLRTARRRRDQRLRSAGPGRCRRARSGSPAPWPAPWNSFAPRAACFHNREYVITSWERSRPPTGRHRQGAPMRRPIRALAAAAACSSPAPSPSSWPPARHRPTPDLRAVRHHHDPGPLRRAEQPLGLQRRAVHQRHRHRLLDHQPAGQRQHQRRAGVVPVGLPRLPLHELLARHQPAASRSARSAARPAASTTRTSAARTYNASYDIWLDPTPRTDGVNQHGDHDLVQPAGLDPADRLARSATPPSAAAPGRCGAAATAPTTSSRTWRRRRSPAGTSASWTSSTTSATAARSPTRGT